MRSKQKTRIGISQLKTPDSPTTSTDNEAVQLLCDFFTSVYIKDGDDAMPTFHPDLKSNKKLENIDFSVNDVRMKLNHLKENSSRGPDNLHPKLLTRCSDILAAPIFLIMKKSLEEGIVPQAWRKSQITPIHKKGSRSDNLNYRPIALTCVLCKVMESIIKDNMTEHLNDELCLTKHQHGFVSNRSCLTNLLEALESWTASLDNPDMIGVDTVYLNIKRLLIGYLTNDCY